MTTECLILLLSQVLIIPVTSIDNLKRLKWWRLNNSKSQFQGDEGEFYLVSGRKQTIFIPDFIGMRAIYSIIIIFKGFSRFLGTGYELALLRFVFLSLGDASASVDEKKSKIYAKESILILLCFRPNTI